MNGVRRAVIAAARRTAVAPRGGALSGFQADELAAPVLSALVEDAGLSPDRIDHVILGNALYAGGNPARLAALRAGLPQTVPALTVDTQCCSGLDAIVLGARLIESGAAECVLAGGTESFSRAPIRMHRPGQTGEKPVAYDRPAFAPPPYSDPDLADAAADLAARRHVSRVSQSEFAMASHGRAFAAARRLQNRLVTAKGAFPDRDGFTRRLSERLALRAPLLNGSAETGLTAATIACEADGAAAVLLMSEERAARQGLRAIRILAAASGGGDPADPALVPVRVAVTLLDRLKIKASDLSVVELMEAYAVQAMVTVAELGIDPASLNLLGGALARGHPIGASGAVLAVHLYDQLAGAGNPAEAARTCGMALIAAAGGLGAGIVVEPAANEGG